MSSTELFIDIAPDEEDLTYTATLRLPIEDGDGVIGLIPKAVADLDEDIFEDFIALCIRMAKVFCAAHGIRIKNYSIRKLY